jgi:hypothetical protein
MIKQTTKTTRKKITSNVKGSITATNARIQATMSDFKSALLVVSLLINAFVLIGWIALRITTQYDLQVATFLFIR